LGFPGSVGEGGLGAEGREQGGADDEVDGAYVRVERQLDAEDAQRDLGA
jgi:hypothetical protein